MSKVKFVWPLLAFALLVALLAVGLNRDPHDVPSPLINKPAPQFSLPQLDQPASLFSSKSMLGRVWMLNVWATWCEACREEHAQLVEIAKDSAVPMIGMNYKEVRDDGSIDISKLSAGDEQRMAVDRANKFLAEHGNPYTAVVMDLDGRVGIDFGVYGVPETYVIDKNGVIRLKVTGSISPDQYRNTIVPLLKELNA